MSNTHLTTAPAGDPIDLRHLDATLTNLRQAARTLADMTSHLAEARDRVAAAPNDPEARRAVRLAGLRVRADAATLAHYFAAVAQPDGTIP